MLLRVGSERKACDDEEEARGGSVMKELPAVDEQGERRDGAEIRTLLLLLFKDELTDG